MKPRLMFFSNCSARNGAPRVITRLCSVISKTHEAAIVFPADGPARRETGLFGIRTFCVRDEESPYRRYEEKDKKRIVKILRDFDPQTVVANTVGSLIPAHAAAAGYKTFLFLHEIIVQDNIKKLNEIRKIASGCHGVISVTRALIEHLRGYVHEEKLHLFRPGVDICEIQSLAKALNAPLPSADGRKFISFVGAICPLKGAGMLPDFAQHLKELTGGWVIAAAGAVPPKFEAFFADLKNRVHSMGLERDILFLGELENPYPLMARASLLVHPSQTEALSLVIMESMALEVPAAAFDVGGNSEIIEHESDGILAKPFDIKALARYSARMLDTPSAFRTRAALKIQTQFDITRTYPQFLNILEGGRVT